MGLKHYILLAIGVILITTVVNVLALHLLSPQFLVMVDGRVQERYLAEEAVTDYDVYNEKIHGARNVKHGEQQYGYEQEQEEKQEEKQVEKEKQSKKSKAKAKAKEKEKEKEKDDDECDEPDCSCGKLNNMIDDIRDSMEVQYGFKKTVRGPFVSSVKNLKRISVKIPREDGRKLSYAQFLEKYVRTETPVIITNYHKNMFGAYNWTLEYIHDMCYNSTARLSYYDSESGHWGNLRHDKEESRVGDFVHAVQRGKSKNGYLFDWSVPHNCPDLLRGYAVPKYFAGDYLQRIPNEIIGKHSYRNTWPSLFIGSGKTRSGLHVDSFQSHFWMALMRGHKRWAVVPPNYVPFLYRSTKDETFLIGDLFDVDVTKYPLVTKALVYDDILGPNEIIFVPGGAAHQVLNMDTVIAISMNYFDEWNFYRSIEHFSEETRDFIFSNKFTRGLAVDQKDLPWKRYKTFPRINEEYDFKEEEV